MSENNQSTTKSENSTLKTALIIIASVFVIIILIVASIAYAVHNFYKTVRGDLFGNNPEYITAICPNSDKISVSRKEINLFGIRQVQNQVSYYKASDLSRPYPPSFDLDTYSDSSVSGLDILEYNKKSTIQYTFPFIPKMQQDFNFKIIDQNKFNQNQTQQISQLANKNHINLYVQKNTFWSYKGDGYDGADGIPATYINSNKMSKDEFEGMTGCLKNASEGKLTLDKSYTFNNIEPKEYFQLNRVLVYGLPVMAKGTAVDKKTNFLFAQKLECQDPNFPVFIRPNGATILTSRLYTAETPVNAGYFDQDGSFIQEKDIKNTIVSASGEDGRVYTQDSRDKKDSSADQFPVELKVNRGLKLLFNDKQEPIDDYLKTCKNEQGKNIFELYNK
ncbi:MAG: hypothetical protein WCK98_07220 [bacterium]